jgi:hypothetical protein
MRHRRVAAARREPALHGHGDQQQHQRHAAERRRLSEQRRHLLGEIDDLGRENVEAERHAQQQLDLERFEQSHETEEEHDHERRGHDRQRHAQQRAPAIGARGVAGFFQRRIHVAKGRREQDDFLRDVAGHQVHPHDAGK